jgi:hypothetical protein
MYIFIVFASCLLYTLCSSQATVTYPVLGSVYSVPNNNSVLNFTFIYPTNYQFDNLYVRFTIYDFSANEITNPQPSAFSYVNFTNGNISLPWVVPNVGFQPGAYVIICFEWVQTTSANQLVSDTNQCLLTRATINSTIPANAIPTYTLAVGNSTATMIGYFPAELPYDQINITSSLNGNIAPSSANTTLQNSTYSEIGIFTFTNLDLNTAYNACIYFNYMNSIINGSQTMYSQCTMTSATTTTNNNTTTTTTTTTNNNNTTTATNNRSSNKVISKLIIFMILLMYFFI